jgi:hypothetical protein
VSAIRLVSEVPDHGQVGRLLEGVRTVALHDIVVEGERRIWIVGGVLAHLVAVVVSHAEGRRALRRIELDSGHTRRQRTTGGEASESSRVDARDVERGGHGSAGRGRRVRDS